jgi:hypothetical protein
MDLLWVDKTNKNKISIKWLIRYIYHLIKFWIHMRVKSKHKVNQIVNQLCQRLKINIRKELMS